MLRVLDLFSGIGGFSLGLERTGFFRTVAFCEIDAKARAVLRKHWPDVEQFDDVRSLSRDGLELYGIESVDVICGGFPCQDISLAGLGAGLSGDRSGLWYEYHRLIAEIRPQFALVENVAALRSRGLDEVLGSLAQIGYDAEWHCIPASAVGAPHQRDRVWIVAYPNTGWLYEHRVNPGGGEDGGLPITGRSDDGQAGGCRPLSQLVGELPTGQWPEPGVGRVAYGVPDRMDRLGQLGNAVVPQIPQMLGEAIAKRLALDLV